jgi:AraC family transcriptional regulator
MQPRIVVLEEMKLVGKKIRMSLTNNKTRELWQSFMTRRKEITNNTGSELYSVEVYEAAYFINFNPHTEFDKWAAIEVKDFDTVPNDMETITIPVGRYAVFTHKGPASTGPKTLQYIFQTWLPNSSYTLDNRHHFEIMGTNYKGEDPDSEEELWIPIKPK